ncbi:MAG: hypothetical protein K2P41_11055 [Lachnospiraceae bacterium]|nr:hypothetical protein [Lachnospiraceae bacterium]
MPAETITEPAAAVNTKADEGQRPTETAEEQTVEEKRAGVARVADGQARVADGLRLGKVSA